MLSLFKGTLQLHPSLLIDCSLMMLHRFAAIVLACSCLVSGAAAQIDDSGRRPNVLFISVDDWNDWVGCLGHKQAITPNLDRLATSGMLFTNAHCAAPSAIRRERP